MKEAILKRSKLNEVPLWVHGWSWGIFLGFIFLFLVAFLMWRDVNVWEGFKVGQLHKHPYAERVHEVSVFRTRANTWSNLSYVLVGLYAIFLGLRDRSRGWKDEDGYLVNTPAMSILFGLACCYLGFGSALFHASLTKIGQQVDVAGMYSPLVVLWGINLGRWAPRFPGKAAYRSWPVIALLILVACALLFYFKWDISAKKVLPSLIIVVLCCVVIDTFSRRRNLCAWWAVIAFVMLLIGTACRQIDVAHAFSGPDVLWQGHSFWHLFTTVTLAGMYLYYRSEKIAT